MNSNKKSLFKNTMFNLLGYGLPLIVAVLLVPSILKQMGNNRFGILMILWAVMNYSAAFDLGIGRALTHFLAKEKTEKVGSVEYPIEDYVWTSIYLLCGLGFAGTLLGFGLSKLAAYHFLKIPAFLQHETCVSIMILSTTFPMTILTSGLRGILQGKYRFDLVNFVQIPIGILSIFVPFIIVHFNSSLTFVLFTICVIRFFMVLIYAYQVLKLLPHIRVFRKLTVALIRPILTFGGWVTVSNMVGAVLVYADRIIIGGFVTASLIVYYTLPHEIVTKFWAFAVALSSVMFPAFSAVFKTDMKRAAKLFFEANKFVFITTVPLVFIISMFAGEILNLWLGLDFKLVSTQILQILAFGVLFNSLAQIPYNFIQGVGRPELSARLHLIELPVYITGLLFLVKMFGIKGAAIAWSTRIIIDAIVLFIIAFRLLPYDRVKLKVTLGILGGTLVLLAGTWFMTNIYLKMTAAVVFLIGFSWLSWKKFLNTDDRQFLIQILNKAVFRG
ncbi:MAG: flippase [Candidatus Omnitrophica bacterium]|nr:flippase [Candidatus Omnitrophota bacterium]